MDPKQLVNSLAQWWWMPKHPRFYVDVWDDKPGRAASLNLFWALTGCPQRFDFANNMDTWSEINQVVLLRVGSHTIEDYALVYKPGDFCRKVLLPNPEIFSKLPGARAQLMAAAQQVH